MQGIPLQGFITRREALGLFRGFPLALSYSKIKKKMYLGRTEKKTELIRVKVSFCFMKRDDNKAPVLCLLRERGDEVRC